MMKKPEYSYLDLCVLPQLRELVLSPEPALVFDADIETVLWVNAAGAEFFGGDGVAEMLSSRPSPSQPFIQQLQYACAQLEDGEPLSRGFRVVRGLRSELIQCELTMMHLPQGEAAVLLQCSDEKLSRTKKEHEIASATVNSLEGFADAAAIIDDYTLTIASTPSFSGIDLSMEDLKSLVDDLLGESDRLVKRPISALDKSTFAAGIARLKDNPGRNLLVLARTGTQEEEKPTSTAPIGLFNQEMAPNADDLEETVDEEVEELVEEEILSADPDADTINTDAVPEGVEHDDDEPVIEVSEAEPHELLGSEELDDEGQTPEESEEPTSDNFDEENDTFGIITKPKAPEPVDEEPAALEAVGDLEDILEPEQPDTAPLVTDEEKEKPFSFDEAANAVRFAWTIDVAKTFQSVSPELGEAVGPNAADIVGRKWSDVATVFGFDDNRVIDGLLSRQDTWSGKSVLWPIQGTDLKVPIDLAALPVFGAGREFEGFRGFGVIRVGDAILDPDATGLALGESPVEKGEADSAPLQPEEIEENDVSIRQELDLEDDFGTEEPPSNVVRLTPEKHSEKSDRLNVQENQAFNKIGETLRKTSDSEWVVGKDNAVNENIENQKPVFSAPVNNEPEDSAQVNDDLEKIRKLDIPVLVYQNEECLFANSQLLELTGYASLEELSSAGGIEALLESNIEEDAEEQESHGSTYLVSSDGSKLQGQMTLRSISWKDGRALMLTFFSSDNVSLDDAEEEPEIEEISSIEISEVSQLQNILKTATDGIIVLDKAGLIVSINSPAEALFGIEHSAVSNKSVDILFAVESHDAIDKAIATLTRETEEDTPINLVGSVLNDGLELVGRETNGGLIPLLVRFGKIGSSDKLCAIIRDMSSWKKAEEDLVQARRQAEIASEHKSDFLARVSHEIRTPLNAIIGFSDVMIEERFGIIENERYREYLRDINRSGVHVLDLINDLLDLSKIESGKIDLSFEAVDLNKIVSETVALMQPQANGRRIIIRTSLSRAVPKVVADARAMRQIIMNLVSNAIKFSQRNGQVIVSTVYESNGEVALRIRDTGIGMSESELKDAMKPFHQIPGAGDRRGEGTGLGLPLTKALVDANKAYFDLESAAGKGTIAHVQFPTQRVLAD